MMAAEVLQANALWRAMREPGRAEDAPGGRADTAGDWRPACGIYPSQDYTNAATV